MIRRASSLLATYLPWGAALVALVALVALSAGGYFGGENGSGASTSPGALPTASMDGRPSGPQGGGAVGAGGAPDIGSMSPSERASRLYVRVMEYAETGKVDSVAMFAPMVMAAHGMLVQPTLDERYHYGRVAEVVGAGNVAKAQADTILAASPSNLLGLVLAVRAARLEDDARAEAAFNARLLAALQSELATNNEDYINHRPEIDRAVEESRRP